MAHFMDNPDRIGFFIDKFGLDRNDHTTWKGVESIMIRGFDLGSDYEDFLLPTI